MPANLIRQFFDHYRLHGHCRLAEISLCHISTILVVCYHRLLTSLFSCIHGNVRYIGQESLRATPSQASFGIMKQASHFSIYST
jgi:hypothetical protein